MNMRRKLATLALAGAAIALGSPAALAKGGHDDDDDHHERKDRAQVKRLAPPPKAAPVDVRRQTGASEVIDKPHVREVVSEDARPEDWGAGHWRQAEFAGRYGWWWVVGDAWYPMAERLQGTARWAGPTVRYRLAPQ